MKYNWMFKLEAERESLWYMQYSGETEFTSLLPSAEKEQQIIQRGSEEFPLRAHRSFYGLLFYMICQQKEYASF